MPEPRPPIEVRFRSAPGARWWDPEPRRAIAREMAHALEAEEQAIDACCASHVDPTRRIEEQARRERAQFIAGSISRAEEELNAKLADHLPPGVRLVVGLSSVHSQLPPAQPTDR